MTTERLDIVVSDSGSETVKRNINEIGNTSVTATNNVGILNRALAGIGGAASAAGSGIASVTKTLGDFARGIGEGVRAEGEFARAATGATSALNAQATASRSATGATNAHSSSLLQSGVAARAAEGNLQSMGRTARQLTGALQGLAALALAKEFLSYADAATNVERAIAAVIPTADRQKASFQALVAVSKDTFSSIGTNAKAFQNITNALKSTGASGEQAIPILRTVNQSIMLSGASGKVAASALSGIADAMRQNVVSGADLRKIYQDSATSVGVLAQGVGVSVTELLRMADAGQLSGRQVQEAFSRMRDTVELASQGYLPTLSQAWDKLQSSIVAYVSSADSSSGITGTLARLMNGLASNIDSVVAVLGPVVIGFTALAGLQVASWVLGLVGGFVTLTARMLAAVAAAEAFGIAFIVANPLLAGIAATVLAIAAALIYATGGWDAFTAKIQSAIKSFTDFGKTGAATASSTTALNQIFARQTGTIAEMDEKSKALGGATRNLSSAQRDQTAAASSGIGANNGLAGSYSAAATAARDYAAALAAANSQAVAHGFASGSPTGGTTAIYELPQNDGIMRSSGRQVFNNTGGSFSTDPNIQQLGYANGGAWTVKNSPGVYGADKVPVFFYATPGERVIVQNTAQQAAANTNMYMHPGSVSNDNHYASGGSLSVGGGSYSDGFDYSKVAPGYDSGLAAFHLRRLADGSLVSDGWSGSNISAVGTINGVSGAVGGSVGGGAISAASIAAATPVNSWSAGSSSREYLGGTNPYGGAGQCNCGGGAGSGASDAFGGIASLGAVTHPANDFNAPEVQYARSVHERVTSSSKGPNGAGNSTVHMGGITIVADNPDSFRRSATQIYAEFGRAINGATRKTG